MAASSACAVFRTTELCEQILEQAVQGERIVQDLFVLQRVNKTFKEVIDGSSRFRIAMGVQYADAGPARKAGTQSPAVKALRHQISFTPFYASTTNVPAAARQFTRNAHEARDDPWRFDIDAEGWGETIGVSGVQGLHMSRAASWRRIKLFAGPHPLKIAARVRLCDASDVDAQYYLPAARQTRSTAENDHSTLTNARRARYVDSVSFTAEESTLGNLADVLDGVLRRGGAGHDKLSRTPVLGPRSFGGPDHMGIADEEDEEGIRQRRMQQVHHFLVLQDDIHNLPENLLLAFAVSMSLEDS